MEIEKAELMVSIAMLLFVGGCFLIQLGVQEIMLRREIKRHLGD